MRKSKIAGISLAAVFAVVMVYSVVRMSDKVTAYHKQSNFPHFRFDIIGAREFAIFDSLPVSIKDEPKGDQGFLHVTYAQSEVVAPVKMPPALNVPNLGIYDEWAKVIEIHEVGRTESGSLGDKVGSGRVVLVTRRTPSGYDPNTWGSVFRDAWLFDFYEFTREGKIERSTFRWPRGELGQMTLERLVEEGNEQAKTLAAVTELPERSWQYNAALHVIPKLNVPKYRFKDTAVRAMGWTLPTAGFAGLGLIIGVCVFFAPPRVK